MKITFNPPEDTLLPVRHEAEGETCTIFLTKNDGLIRNYRCNNCSRLVFQYQGNVALVVDNGDGPNGTGSSFHQCPRCSIMYRLIW